MSASHLTPRVPPGIRQESLSLLAAVVRGETPVWPVALSVGDLLRVATEQGLDVLVASHADGLGTWPEDVRTELAATERNACVIEVVREREMVRVLSALHDAHVAPLLVKGAALAYGYMRPRICGRGSTPTCWWRTRTSIAQRRRWRRWAIRERRRTWAALSRTRWRWHGSTRTASGMPSTFTGRSPTRMCSPTGSRWRIWRRLPSRCRRLGRTREPLRHRSRC